MLKTYVMSNTQVPFDILFAVALDHGMLEPVMSIPGNGIQCAVHCHNYNVLDAQTATSEYATGVATALYYACEPWYDMPSEITYEVRKTSIADNTIIYILDSDGDCI